MALQEALAALLLAGPSHGYQLMCTLESELGPLWETRASRVYLTVARMEPEGVYPRLSADHNLSYHYDASTGAFAMQAHGHQGDAPTVVYVPREVTGDVTSSGGLANQTVGANADGSRVVTATPSGGGFSIAVAAAPLALTACA